MAPQVGLVQDSPTQFQQVPYFSGVEVSELVAGEDFTLALVRRKEEETITPVAEEEEARPHCPLGLPLGEEDKGEGVNLSLGEEDKGQADKLSLEEEDKGEGVNLPLGEENKRPADNVPLRGEGMRRG